MLCNQGFNAILFVFRFGEKTTGRTSFLLDTMSRIEEDRWSTTPSQTSRQRRYSWQLFSKRWRLVTAGRLLGKAKAVGKAGTAARSGWVFGRSLVAIRMGSLFLDDFTS